MVQLAHKVLKVHKVKSVRKVLLALALRLVGIQLEQLCHAIW
jgi:hypothetical protein